MSGTPEQAILDPELGRRIDEVCNRFEAAWKAGTPPAVADFLDGWSGPPRRALLRELVLLDIHYRRRHGRSVDADGYRHLAEFDSAWLAEGSAADGAATAEAPTRSRTGGMASTRARKARWSAGMKRRISARWSVSRVGRCGTFRNATSAGITPLWAPVSPRWLIGAASTPS